MFHAIHSKVEDTDNMGSPSFGLIHNTKDIESKVGLIDLLCSKSLLYLLTLLPLLDLVGNWLAHNIPGDLSCKVKFLRDVKY